MSNKKARGTKQFHPHNALLVQMRVQQNHDSMFDYMETTS